MLYGTLTCNKDKCWILDTEDMIIEEYFLYEIREIESKEHIIENYTGTGVVPFSYLALGISSIIPSSIARDSFIYILEMDSYTKMLRKLSVWLNGKYFVLEYKGINLMFNDLFLDTMKFCYPTMLGLLDGDFYLTLSDGISYMAHVGVPREKEIGLRVNCKECSRETFLRKILVGGS